MAVASAAGPGSRAVLRLSGPHAARIVGALCSSSADSSSIDLGSRAVFEVLFDDGVGLLPARLLWMPGPRSFTAEDVAELHLPGHHGLVAGALERLLVSGATLAEPGEFTRRAFQNGRIDLTQAEGVAALVAARSRDERRAATALLVGGLERRVRAIRTELEAVRALSEASLDFDEADTGHVPVDSIVDLGERALSRIREALGWERQRSASDRVARVVLAGAPNAGKSTLFNRLVGEAGAQSSGPAIVSDFSGTTRDAKRGDWCLVPGAVASVFDTAGLGEHAPRDAEPDRLAAKRAQEMIESADLVLWVIDASTDAGSSPPPGIAMGEIGSRVLRVWNKADLLAEPRPPLTGTQPPGTQPPGTQPYEAPTPGIPAHEIAAHEVPALGSLSIAAETGEGIDRLTAACAKVLGFTTDAVELPDASGVALAAAAAGWGLGPRHLAALEAAAVRTAAALEAIQGSVPLDLVAEDLKLATESLDEIAGRTVPEDLLDRIFAQFCLGK